MTFAVDNVASYDQVLGGYSWLFTPVATTPQGIFAYNITYDGGGNDYITGMTYGGVAMTKVGVSQGVTKGGVTGWGQAWYLPLNTLSGPQTVAVQKSGTPSSNSVSVMVVSYTTSSPATTIRTGSGGITGIGNTVPSEHWPITITNPAHIHGFCIEPDLSSPSQVSPFGSFVDVLEDDWGIRMSNYAQVVGVQPAGVYNTGWTFSPSTSCVFVVLSVEEGPVIFEEGGAGFDEWWDVMDGTLSDASDINAAITVPLADLSDVNDSVGTAPTTQDVFVYDHTNDEWTRDSVVDGGTP